MNLILFEAKEIGLPLERNDPRARHITEVLAKQIGETFDVGVVCGPRGRARIVAIDRHALTLDFELGTAPAPLPPVRLLCGLPRPQTARDILREATSIGVESITFCPTERGEASYARSRLWTKEEYRQLLIRGAELSFTTMIPRVSVAESFEEAVRQEASEDDGLRIALDNYEGQARLSDELSERETIDSCTIAVGAERGWSPDERRILRREGFLLVGLGDRVLRAETATIAGLVLVLAAMGRM